MQHPSTVLPLELRVRKLYGKFLSTWAMDLMTLRRQGLAMPSAREADDPLTVPLTDTAEEPCWTTSDPARLLTWNPAPVRLRMAA